MGQIAVAVKHLIQAGVTGEDLVRAIEDMEAARPAVDAQADRRRAKDRERKRAAKASVRDSAESAESAESGECGVVEGGIPQISAESADVAPLSPHTPLSDIYYLVISARTREERLALQSQIRRERFREVLDEVKVRLNGSADWTKLAVQHANPLIQLIAPAEGEPCSIEDVYAAAEETGRQFHAKGKPLTNWGYLRTVALSFRDARLRPAPEVEIIDEPATSDSSASGGGRQPVEDRQRSQRQPQRDTLFAATMRYHDRVSHE